MRAPRLAAAAAALLISALAAADNTAVPFADKEGCMIGPMAEFGQYIGNWDIQDWQLSQDGSEWTAGTGARWNFVCIGNGTAVQDFWMPHDGGVGTNLRTYNAETESWDIAWTINPLPGFAHIQAKMQEDGRIVMQYKAPLPDPLRRITFFPPDDNGWDWQLELSRDGGESWFEVYRIKATPSE